MIRIGIDLHGTLTEDVKTGRTLINFMELCLQDIFQDEADQIEIIIISGEKSHKAIVDELKTMDLQRGKHYTSVISVVEYLQRLGNKFIYDEEGNPWCDDEIWWESKRNICKDLNISMLIDDQEKYGDYFSTYGTVTFMLYSEIVSIFKFARGVLKIFSYTLYKT